MKKPQFSVKSFSLVAAFLLVACNLKAQENYSFMKLMVQNAEGKILLVKWDGEWEVPGAKFNEPQSVFVFLQGMAETTGVEIRNHQIFGMYTQRWVGAGYLTLMQYYKADYVSGELKVPEDCTEVGWFSKEEALKLIPYDNMKYMLQWEMDHPGKIAAAAFERYKDENNVTQFNVLEAWHTLN